MFDKVVNRLVEMKDSQSRADIIRYTQASQTILHNVGYDALSQVVDFLPSLPLLFESIDITHNTSPHE